MSWPAVLAVAAAGLWAGAINTVVGSGSLVTFPTLLALGFSPLVANVSNTVGLVGGAVSGAVGYRRELRGQRGAVIGLALPAVLGGVLGAVLLLRLPGAVFDRMVPLLVLGAVALVLVQPRLSSRLNERRGGRGRRWTLRGGVLVTGVYGGYFGAAQGVILIGLLGLLLDDTLQRLNGLKNVLAAMVNGVAAVIFIFSAPVAWEPALIIAVSSILGGQMGAVVGRRLSPTVLRAMIVVGGLVVVAKLLL